MLWASEIKLCICPTRSPWRKGKGQTLILDIFSSSHSYSTSSWKLLSPESQVSGWCLCPSCMNLSSLSTAPQEMWKLSIVSHSAATAPWLWSELGWGLGTGYRFCFSNTLHTPLLLLALDLVSLILGACRWKAVASNVYRLRILFCFLWNRSGHLMFVRRLGPSWQKPYVLTGRGEMLRDGTWVDGKAFFSDAIA